MAGGRAEREISFSLSLSVLFFSFLGLHLQHMEVPRPGVDAGLHHSHSNTRSEPHLNLSHSLQQCWILNPLRGQESNIHPCTDNNTRSLTCYSLLYFLKNFFFFLVFLGPHQQHGGRSQARDSIRATATSLHHSHSNMGSEMHW